ncbi:MAG: iron-containing alcohol dehydrogenase, partial [Ancrocorticia sp.]
MSTNAVDEALEQAEYTKVIEVGRGVLSQAGKIFIDNLLGGSPCLLVADERTWKAAGAALHDQLQAAGATLTEPLIYPGQPTLYASYDHAEEIREKLRATGALGIAIGSGTINDLTKLASGELDQPYGALATAASMDGYTGFGAPMTRDGLKITMPCPAPRVVVFDLDVAAAAPSPMAASGYGDLSAKIPAGADWILADAGG